MTQVTGRPGVNIFEGSKNIRDLSDGRGYRVGKDGSLKKTNKAGTFFKESFSADTVKKQNQKTLDTLMRQLAQDYGDAAAARGRENLTLPKEVLLGKRVITGRTLKDIAASVRAVSASMVQSTSGPLTSGLKEILGKENPTPAEVLQTIHMNMPKDGDTQVRQMAFQQAVSALDKAKLGKLLSVMSGPSVAQAKQLLDTAVESVSSDLKFINRSATESKAMAALIPVRDAIAMTYEGLRVCGNVNNRPMPEVRTNGTAGWKKPDAEAMKILEAFNLGRLNLAKLALSDTLPKEEKESLFRGNSFGITLFRSIGSDTLYGPFKGVVDDLKETFLGRLDDLMKLCDATNLNSLPGKMGKSLDNLPLYLDLVLEAMQKRPELQKCLGECVSLMREHVEPLLRERFADETTTNILYSAFNGLFSVGVTGTLSVETYSIEDERTRAALFGVVNVIQGGMASKRLTPDQPFGKYMDSVPGWKELSGTK